MTCKFYWAKEEGKVRDNNTSSINKEVTVYGQKLEIVTSFKYLGSLVSDEGSKPEILSTNLRTTAALTKLKPVWNDSSTDKVETNLEWQQHFTPFQDTSGWSPLSHPPSCMLFHATEKTDKSIFMGERCSSVNLIYRQKMKLETLKQNRKQRNELTSAVSC